MLTPTASPNTRRRFGDVSPDNDGELRLRTGDIAPEVEDWQSNLKLAGYAVNVTGKFDTQTASATVQFKSAHGLPATEVVDDATRTAMADLLDAGAGPSRPVGPVLRPAAVDISGRSIPAWVLAAIPIFGWLMKRKKRKN